MKPDFSTILEETLEAWAYTREGVISEVRNVSERDLAFRPTPESRTFRELVVHILESGTLMSGELSRPDADFHRKPYETLLKEHARGLGRARTRAQLAAALKRTHAEGDRKLRSAGELSILQLITRFDGRKGTRLAWMHHGISHEEYHRGQLALYARSMGRVPALTRLIMGE
jgi:uncharacterized damage-inducible protein DinB